MPPFPFASCGCALCFFPARELFEPLLPTCGLPAETVQTGVEIGHVMVGKSLQLPGQNKKGPNDFQTLAHEAELMCRVQPSVFTGLVHKIGGGHAAQARRDFPQNLLAGSETERLGKILVNPPVCLVKPYGVAVKLGMFEGGVHK